MISSHNALVDILDLRFIWKDRFAHVRINDFHSDLSKKKLNTQSYNNIKVRTILEQGCPDLFLESHYAAEFIFNPY